MSLFALTWVSRLDARPLSAHISQGKSSPRWSVWATRTSHSKAGKLSLRLLWSNSVLPRQCSRPCPRQVPQTTMTSLKTNPPPQASGLPASIEQMSLSRAAGDVAMTALYPAHQEFVLRSVAKVADIVTCSWDDRPETAHDLQRIRLYQGIRQLGLEQKGAFVPDVLSALH